MRVRVCACVDFLHSRSYPHNTDGKSPQRPGGYLEGFDNLTAEGNELGSAAWLSAQGFPQDIVDKAAELEAGGKVSWNGWRGDMAWLAPAAPGYEAGKPTADGHAPPAAYTAEQSDTYIMCNHAIDYIESQATEAAPWAVHLSLLKPHPPLIAPRPYNEMYPLASVALPEHRAPTAEEEVSLSLPPSLSLSLSLSFPNSQTTGGGPPVPCECSAIDVGRAVEGKPSELLWSDHRMR